MANEVNITITADDMSGPEFAKAMARLRELRAAAKDVSGDLNISPKLDMGSVGSELTSLKAKLGSIGIADIVDVNIPTGRVVTQLQLLKRLIGQAGIQDVLDFNIQDSELTRRLAQLKGVTETIPVRFAIQNLPGLGNMPHVADPFNFTTSSGFVGSMQAASNVARNLGLTLSSVNAQTRAFNAQANQAAQGANTFRNAAAAAAGAAAGAGGGGGGGLAGAAAAAAGAMAGGAGGAGGAGAGGGMAGAAGMAGARMGWFGGIIGGTVGGIGLWHLAVDGAIEALLVLVTAAGAAAAGLAAMYPTAQDLYTQLKSIQSVNSALGTQIPPLTGQFQALQQAMAPRTIEIYGGALNIVKQNTGGLAGIATQVVGLFDTWTAKIDLWANKNHQLNNLLQTGIGFLDQFGHIFGSLGQAISNLIKSDPGTAHFLLDIVGAAAGLLNWVSRLPHPILETGLAIHSFYLWGSAALGVLAKMPGAYGALFRAVVGIPGPLRIALAAVGILAFEMARAWDTSSLTVTKDIEKINANLDTLAASQAIYGISNSINDIYLKMGKVTGGQILAGWGTFSGRLQGVDDKLQLIGHDFGQAFSGSAWHQITSMGDALKLIFAPPSYGTTRAAYSQVQKDVEGYRQEIEKLTGNQMNLYLETNKLMGQNYTYSQSLALMDLAGVKQSDSLAVMDQKVQNLITGYQNVAGGAGGIINSVDAITFAALQQQSQVSALNTGWDTFFTTVSGGESGLLSFAQALATIATNAQTAQLNTDGLNASQITAGQNFITAASAANKQQDNLTLLANAAGLGQAGIDMLNQSTKDMVQMLLPAAKNSADFTTILYNLAQRGGYEGANSFAALSEWIGKTKNPMKDLQKNTTTLTTDAGNLLTDVQNLSTALGVNLTKAMSDAITAALGAPAAFDAVATGLFHGKTDGDKFNTSLLTVMQTMYLADNKSIPESKAQFETWAKAMGVPISQADYLWQRELVPLNNWIAAHNDQSFNIRLNPTAGGTITATPSPSVGGLQKQYQLLFSILGKAGGGRVPGGFMPGMDNQLMMASPGEFVLVPEAAQALGYGRLDSFNRRYAKGRGGTGFAGGGIAGEMAGVSNWLGGIETGVFGADAASWGNAVNKVFQNAAKKAAVQSWGLGGVGTSSARTGSIAVEEAFAASLLSMYGWGQDQMAGLIPLWMQESGWNPYAVNPSSGAYGIPQSLGHGHPYNLGDYQNQEIWGLNYIRSVYGSPLAAWGHEQAFNWYDSGNWAPPGVFMGYNGTGRPEHLVPDKAGHSQVHLVVQGGQGDFEKFMVQFIRKFVRIAGGGDPFTAFGQD